jgi:P-type Na+/K+ transporter
MDSLKKLSSPTATVLRHSVNGSTATLSSIPTSDIAVGDIVELRAGQVVPADLRLYQVSNLEIDEAILTGESLPVIKAPDVLNYFGCEEIPIGDSINLAYSGTIVTKGRGRGIVYATGMRSEMGKVAEMLSGNKPKHGHSQTKQIIPFHRRALRQCRSLLGLENRTPLQVKFLSLMFSDSFLLLDIG